jgi:hypothetical protein
MSDFVHGRLHPEEALRFLDAIEQDPEASADLDLHVEVLNIANSADAQAFRVRRKVNWTRVTRSVSRASFRSWFFMDRRVLVPVGILLAGIALGLALILSSLASSNQFSHLADLGDLGSSFRMRGLGNADLSDAAAWLVNGQPGEAARRFERYLRMQPSGEWTPWVEYAAGLSRLAEARQVFLGIHISYNADLVKKGLDHMDRVLLIVDNPELEEDALWFRGKGYLMLGDPGSAIHCLTEIQALHRTRSEAARKLLSDLHSLQD